MKNHYEGHRFFVLSKGMNAGKPLEHPCPNCFVIFAKSEEEKNLLYWLCFGLWQGNYFHPFITGSVIPFIRLDDIKTVVCQALQKVELKNGELQKSIGIMKDLQLHQVNILKQLELIKQAKKALMYKVLK
jgi:hypothetical protein